ncbi:hypothetical protein CBR_g21960 [Chara braunii]|uniref:CCHC-type domain-containing protein n=1 Tax=Chara braunii TaxID=69332 RepID=A0A388L1N9_CHABU|nr:hypothetical protein CBR_g21960 [Chara braunii]|eukprot:GBG76211.1 hypothetical protein CBR_g21960 [Chara braunii]
MSRLIKPNSSPARPAPASFPLVPAPPAPGFAPQYPHLANPAGKIECFNYKQPEHFARDCPQPKRNQPPPAAAPVALNQGRVTALMDTDQGGELVAYAPEQPSSSAIIASTSGTSSSDAADMVDPLKYLHLVGMIGAMRSAQDDLAWVDRESNLGPQFPTGDIDVLKTLKQLDILPLINPGHWRLWRETFEELSFCLARVQVKWTGTIEHPTWIENPELLIIQGWRTNAEGDLIGFLFGSVRTGRRQLIAQELIAPIVQLADDLSPDIYFQSDNSPAPYIFERSLDPYVQWTSCLEEPRDEDTLPWRQEYLKPYGIIPHAFYPRAEEVVIDDDDEEEDNDEKTSEEGSYSEHSEGELSEGVEEEEETGSGWEAPPKEATCTGTGAEDPEAARKREEIASGKRQLEFASEASLRIGSDLTRDPEPPRPEDGDPAAATSSTAQRRRRRSPSSSSPTRPPVRPRTNAGDRPSTSDTAPPTP